MKKIIDGTNSVMGRLASYAAKEALKGDEIVVLNCDKVIITGNKDNIKQDFHEKRSRVGSSQKGPKHIKTSERIVKRVIRGMVPNFREGRGREAFKRVKCYNGVPEEFKNVKTIVIAKDKKKKYSFVEEFSKLNN